MKKLESIIMNTILAAGLLIGGVSYYLQTENLPAMADESPSTQVVSGAHKHQQQRAASLNRDPSAGLTGESSNSYPGSCGNCSGCGACGGGRIDH